MKHLRKTRKNILEIKKVLILLRPLLRFICNCKPLQGYGIFFPDFFISVLL